MEKRPRVPVRLTFADLLLELSGWALLVAFWAIVLVAYPQLPSAIPTHYGISGKADASGGKAAILILPVLATVLNAALTALARFPHVLNYPVAITERNAPRQYALALRLIRVTKLLLAGVFATISAFTILTALGTARGVGSWFLPVVLCAFASTLGIYLWRARACA